MRAIFDAKRKYRNLYMLKTEDGLGVVFRILPWGEYKTLLNLLSVFPDTEEEMKDYLFEECVLEYSDGFATYVKDKELAKDDWLYGYVDFGSLYSIIDAGIIEVIFQTIMSLSGADTAEKVFEDLSHVRENSSYDLVDRMTSYVCAALKVDKNSLENLCWEDVLKLIAQGEKILQGEVPGLPFKLADSNAQAIDFDKENREYDEN